jgi:hypothetical protein
LCPGEGQDVEFAQLRCVGSTARLVDAARYSRRQQLGEFTPLQEARARAKHELAAWPFVQRARIEQRQLVAQLVDAVEEEHKGVVAQRVDLFLLQQHHVRHELVDQRERRTPGAGLEQRVADAEARQC